MSMISSDGSERTILREALSIGKIKPVDEFVKERRRINGLSTICKPCENERTKLRNRKR